jgi:hypothetical protein
MSSLRTPETTSNGVSCMAPGSSCVVLATTFRREVSTTPQVRVTVKRSPMRICVVSVRHQQRIGATSTSPGRAAAWAGGCTAGCTAGLDEAGVRGGAAGVCARAGAAAASHNITRNGQIIRIAAFIAAFIASFIASS